MSYPPPQGGYPYPSNQGGLGNIGFSSSAQPGQGPGYPLYPQGGGSGFPCPPSNPSYPGFSGQPSGSTPYNLAPGGATPYPSSNTSVYPPQSSSPNSYTLQSSPYPPVSSYPSQPSQAAPSLYPSVPGSAAYPPAPDSTAYPLAAGSSPYPPAPGSSPYPPAPGSTTYPPAPSSSPYPPAPGSSPYPPPAGSPSYPLGSSSSPYSASGGAAPYPPGYGSGQYPPQSNAPQNSPYPPTGYPYPPGSGNSPLGSSPAQVTNNYSQQTYSQSSQFAHQGGTQGIMWPYQERPTIRPSMSVDASSDAAQLRKAMKGFGTDEATIIRILGRRTSQQRQDILLRYQQSYGRDLVRDLKSELSGQFENVIVALMTPLPTFLAQQINKAISGLGTRERTLIEVLCANDNNTIRNVKAAYQHQFRKPLEADLRGDTSGDFGRLMVAMAAGNRDEMNTNASLAPGLAQSLYKAGVKKMGTDEAEFSRILSVYSYPLLRCVFDEYKKVSGKTFESAIKSELSGDYRDAMLALYECINNRASFFAHYLNLAMRGLGTQDESLIRIVVSRSEIDMGNIKDEYQRKYGKRLEDAIASETSGDYKKVLLALIQG